MKSSKKSKSQSFKDHVYQFIDTEDPEKFIILNINIQSKIVMNTTSFTKWKTIFDNILKLTDKSAKTIVQDIINKFIDQRENILESEKNSQFCDITTLAALNSIVDQTQLTSHTKTEAF